MKRKRDVKVKRKRPLSCKKITDFFPTKKSPPPASTHEDAFLPLIVYTDGSVSDNGNEWAVGGSGVYFGKDDERNLSLPFNQGEITNNRTELFAYLCAMKKVLEGGEEEPPTRLIIHSDSTYGISAMTQWIHGWKRKQWKKRDGTPVANRDLLEEMDQLMRENHNRLRVEFHHVKAHRTEFSLLGKSEEDHRHWKGNQMADQLATQASRSQRKKQKIKREVEEEKVTLLEIIKEE